MGSGIIRVELCSTQPPSDTHVSPTNDPGTGPRCAQINAYRDSANDSPAVTHGGPPKPPQVPPGLSTDAVRQLLDRLTCQVDDSCSDQAAYIATLECRFDTFVQDVSSGVNDASPTYMGVTNRRESGLTPQRNDVQHAT